MLCSFKTLLFPKTMAEAESSSKTKVAIYKLHEVVVDSHGDRIYEMKAVGSILPLAHGIRFEMVGKWSKHPTYGLQFDVETYEEVIAPTKEGIISYLSSGLIKGVGKVTAERIYDAFGDKTLEVLDNRPEDLIMVKGVSKKKVQRIISSYLASRGARDVVAFLAPHNVTPNKAVKIFKHFGPGTISILKENPYRLCEMPGIGFKTADDIAKSLGLNPLAPARIQAGLNQALIDAEKKGNLCLPIAQFIIDCKKLIDTPGMTVEMIADQALAMDNTGKLRRYNGYVFREIMDKTEQAVASKVHELLMFGTVKYKCDINQEIDRIARTMKITVSADQRRAIILSLTSHFSIITGGPGTGKSMILRFLLEIYAKERPDAKIVCCAPTGRASRRMAECTGQPASTVHKVLNLTMEDDGEFNIPQLIDADLILLDESSMMDIFISKHLFSALPYGCQVIFIGDVDQLPSVGPGAVLSELINCGLIPTARLDKVYRQDAGSRVSINARLIRHGNVGLEYGDDFGFIESASFSNSANIIEQLYLEDIKKYGVDNVALLTPYRKKTETSVDALNERLRSKINPPARNKPEITFGRRVFRQGDKVMQLKNRDFISNGDIGYIEKIVKHFDDITVSIDFGDHRFVEYELPELDMLDLAYSCTVHKSQGSEYNSVIISLQMAHYIMLKRPLIYTAITRAKKKVVIVGERKALCMAIKQVDTEKRGTMLASRIIDLQTPPPMVANF